jgi:hypothetical protein
LLTITLSRVQISDRQVEDNGKGLGILKKRKVVKKVVGYADAWPLWNVKKPQPSVGASSAVRKNSSLLFNDFYHEFGDDLFLFHGLGLFKGFFF